jgi:hypothetical protein
MHQLQQVKPQPPEKVKAGAQGMTLVGKLVDPVRTLSYYS